MTDNDRALFEALERWGEVPYSQQTAELFRTVENAALMAGWNGEPGGVINFALRRKLSALEAAAAGAGGGVGPPRSI